MRCPKFKQTIEKHYKKKYIMKTCRILIPKGHGVWYVGQEATKKDPYALRTKKILIKLYKK